MADRLLIALDIDGTILDHDGTIPHATHEQVERLRGEGHEIMLATGRSAADTLPIHRRLGLDSRFVVSANGATVLERDPAADDGYSRRWVETFDPHDVLLRLRDGLRGAMYAVESAEGVFRYNGRFPDGSFEASGREVSFEELLEQPVQRLVVVAPDQTTEEFASAVEAIGLHHVSYSVGWTNWLDIAPNGVNKGTALERVRAAHEIPRDRVVVAGDGRNDIEMLRWAGEFGTAIVMGGSPQDVIDAGTTLAGSFHNDGLGRALAALE
ncbi:HAD family phosphatase [Pseudoclavibacter endophyticus]|uniref:HAD family phosphatase n=1 Tax=Pseudoclavibacter endophyticus TaxID=1778590 RepID=A0A6H9WHN8_9MICO|nr:HAD family phosphatase [Pseudoclavibacter endophyticus]